MFSYISSFFWPETSYNLNVYPLLEGDIAGHILIDENAATPSSMPVETIVILDSSASMDVELDRIVTKVLPRVFSKLSYKSDKTIHMIAFNDETCAYGKQVKDLKSSSLSARGESKMTSAILNCQYKLKTFGSNKAVRILTISKGEIDDVSETLEAAVRQLEFLKKHEFCINSQAVRLVSNSPTSNDTRAITSLLPASSTTIPKLIDVCTSDSDAAIATQIAELFKDDKLEQRRVLKATENIILKTPWDKNPASQILLKPGENIFWLTKNPAEEMKIDDVVVHVQIESMTEEIQLKIQEKIESKRNVTNITGVEGSNEAESVAVDSESHEKNQLTAIRKWKRQNKSANRKLIKDIKRKLNYLKDSRLWTEIGVEAREHGSARIRVKEGNKSKKFIPKDNFNSIEEFMRHNYLWIVAAPIITYAACKLLRH